MLYGEISCHSTEVHQALKWSRKFCGNFFLQINNQTCRQRNVKSSFKSRVQNSWSEDPNHMQNGKHVLWKFWRYWLMAKHLYEEMLFETWICVVVGLVLTNHLRIYMRQTSILIIHSGISFFVGVFSTW